MTPPPINLVEFRLCRPLIAALRERIRGRSTHSLEDLAAAQAEGVDYVGFGPVYGTTTKPDARSRRGVEALAEVCKAARMPVVAIGGINLNRREEVFAAGATCLAVISGVFAAGDPWAAARGFDRRNDLRRCPS